MLLRAISIDEKTAPDGAGMATDLNNLGILYLFMQKYSQAEAPLKRALDIRVKTLGERDPQSLQSMASYAAALRAMKRDSEAKQVEQQLNALRGQQQITVH